jgi:hypothetical protein
MNKVVFIGNFAGGSFGSPGDPCRTYPFYALSSDMEAFTTTREASQLIAFNSKLDAERRLASLTNEAAEEAASARQVRSDRQFRLGMGRNIRAAIEGHTGEPVRQLRWTDRPRTGVEPARRGMPEGGCDAVADGRTFRVWIGPAGQALKIVELTSH